MLHTSTLVLTHPGIKHAHKHIYIGDRSANAYITRVKTGDTHHTHAPHITTFSYSSYIYSHVFKPIAACAHI